MATCCVRSRRAGSVCPPVPGSTSCSIPARCASSATTVRFPPSRCGTDLFASNRAATARRGETGGSQRARQDGVRSMRHPDSKSAITRDQYDAVLLDLDGVITDTANLHAACWKQMFDEYLQKRATLSGEAFRPFDLATDYRLHVDGKPRFDGVRAFLTSRTIQLPEGSLDDPPQVETVGGLGNR